MQELLYTSVPRGLKPGSRGFCTVLSTQGMVAPLAAALEGLSGYRPVFPIGHERVAENPVVYSHLKLQVAGKSWYVLSRIADYGLDYSQRTNKLAHHLVLDKSELPAAGPASLLRASGIMRESWEGDPKIVPPKPISRQPTAPSGVCQAWKEMTGDAGWAGALAESFLKDPNRPVILLFEPGQDLRPLIDESLSLLPAERRWDVTFSTYFTGSSQGITCLWRGIVVGSKEATESLRFVNALRIDLTSADFGRAEGGELVDAARKGVRPSARPAMPPKQAAPREQHEPRVVLMDDVDERAKPKSPQAPADTPIQAAMTGSHDHAQAPPVLTRSAFKFANAGRQTGADDPEVRTSRLRRFIIPLLVLVLLGGSAAAIVALNRQSPKSQALSHRENSKPQIPEVPDDSKSKHLPPKMNGNDGVKSEQEQAAEAAQIALAKKEAEDEKRKAEVMKAEQLAQAEKEAAAKKVVEDAAKKKEQENATAAKAKAEADKHRVEFLELFEGSPAKLKSTKDAHATGLSAELLSTATLTLMTPFKEKKVVARFTNPNLTLETKQEEQFGTFKIVVENESLAVKFDVLKSVNVSKYLRFCTLRLQAGNRIIDFRFFKPQSIAIQPFHHKSEQAHHGTSSFASAELKEAMDQQVVIQCDNLVVQTTEDELRNDSLTTSKNGPLLEWPFDKELCAKHLIEEKAKLFIQKDKSRDDHFEIRVNCDPLSYSVEQAQLCKELVAEIKNGPLFLDEFKKYDSLNWKELDGIFTNIQKAFDGIKKDESRKAAEKFMAALNGEQDGFKGRKKKIDEKVEVAEKAAKRLSSASMEATFSFRVAHDSQKDERVELLRLTKGNAK
jgi:hypothetical protein